MIDPRYSHLANDLILLNENVPNNEKPERGLYQIHAGVKIVDRDNILSEYRGTDSRIPLALSDP
jgi:hypothetical protein